MFSYIEISDESPAVGVRPRMKMLIQLEECCSYSPTHEQIPMLQCTFRVVQSMYQYRVYNNIVLTVFALGN